MDKLIKALICDDFVSVIAISGRDMVQKAKQAHETSAVCTAALGRTLMATCMLGNRLKNDTDSVTVQIQGGGPAGNIVCVGYPDGRVKGYIANPSVELELNEAGKLDVAGAVGQDGSLTVIRDLSLKEPYIGKIKLVSGEIAEDFAKYLLNSEQSPSLVYLGVHITNGEVSAAGGIIIQPLPGCPETEITWLETHAGEITRLTYLLDEGKELGDVLRELFTNMQIRIIEEQNPEYRCNCSRERLERVLISLGEEELGKMVEEDEGAEVTCQFCNKKYNFSGNELLVLKTTAKE